MAKIEGNSNQKPFFFSNVCIQKHRLQYDGHFVQVPMYYRENRATMGLLHIRKVVGYAGAANAGIFFGWRLRPPTIYDEIGAAARNIQCYTVIGFW